MTQKAVVALRQVVAEAGDAEIRGIRIAVAGGGCFGYQYEMGLEGSAREGDAIIHFGDLMIFVDADSKQVLSGVEVDFCENQDTKGFVFLNPNACGSCGKRNTCGG